jgi:DMSO reductase family type II enzyme heme b subunit
MGETGRGVEITYWSSAWQARAEGRTPEIRSLYPTASVDHYPFEAASLPPGSPEQKAMADRYAPAHALGNFMDGDGVHTVQDLVAEGPGTLTPAPETRSDGRGRWSGGRWELLLTRPLPAGAPPGARTQIAFAVWQGGREEVGARKMRSVWTPFAVGGAR